MPCTSFPHKFASYFTGIHFKNTTKSGHGINNRYDKQSNHKLPARSISPSPRRSVEKQIRPCLTSIGMNPCKPQISVTCRCWIRFQCLRINMTTLTSTHKDEPTPLEVVVQEAKLTANLQVLNMANKTVSYYLKMLCAHFCWHCNYSYRCPKCYKLSKFFFLYAHWLYAFLFRQHHFITLQKNQTIVFYTNLNIFFYLFCTKSRRNPSALISNLSHPLHYRPSSR